MNQILDYNPIKNSGGGSSGSDKVVRVFALILACFAICLLVGGAYGIYKNKSKENIPVATPTKAQIIVEQGESTAKIKVSHDKAIEKLIYSWDSGKENNIKGTGESSMESEIPLLAGTHTLNVKVTDIDGVESTYEQEFTSETGEDITYPVIELEITDEKRLKITATDETAIDFVTYRWNDGEETRVDVSEDDDKKIEFDIEILKGQNSILIVAVDKNSNNTTEQKSFVGVTKPTVEITIAADKKSAEIYCFHENGLKEIKLKINDLDYTVDIGTDNPTEVKLPPIDLEGENNTIIVTAISIDDTETEVTETVTAEVTEEPENPEDIENPEDSEEPADSGNTDNQEEPEDSENADNQEEPEISETSDSEGINISIEKSAENSEIAIARITTPANIKEIKLNINDVDYEVDLGTQELSDLSLDLPLVEGNNRITLKVITVDDIEKEEIKEITR